MRVIFRVDASIAMGTGHVMRCLTLATALRKRGACIQFITRAHSGHLGDMLVRDGFEVTLLPAPNESKLTGYAAWLGVDQNEDASQTIAVLESQQCDWLVVDHYGIDRAWEVLLQPYAHKMMVIDDLANRSHECDLLLDQNYAQCSQERYQPWVTAQCQLLLGPRYALLRSEYAKYRETMPPREGDIKRVLVFMGGSDNTNITGKLLDALSIDKLVHLEVDVVIGQNFTHKAQVTEKVRERPNTNVYGSLPHLAELMARADLAIGAGGVTALERCCMKLPSLVITIAENQKAGVDALHEQGCVILVGDASNVSLKNLEDAIKTFVVVPQKKQSVFCSELVDGKGTDRMVKILLNEVRMSDE